MDKSSNSPTFAGRSEDTSAKTTDVHSNNPAVESPHRAQRAPRGNGRDSRKSRGARGGRNKRSDMGRAEWSRTSIDKRARHEESQQAIKRQRLDGQEPVLPIYATQFSKEEIENEPKRPKRKVAVMMGYSGSGYKGMQLNHNERTIEGDLFKAFVDAGAISKANADDPKKSALIRCARTDKGVHAAGNLISLKLIIEDPDVVQKINEKLSPQIRVFGIERTNGSFSAYQFCDSRIYEYLIPTHCFLPPHPSSYLGKNLVQLADQAGDRHAYEERQAEVSSYWAETEEKYIRPVIDRIDPSIRSLVQRALYDISVKEAEEELAKTVEEIAVVKEDLTPKEEVKSAEDRKHASSQTVMNDESRMSLKPSSTIDIKGLQKPSGDSPKVTVTEVLNEETIERGDEQEPSPHDSNDVPISGARSSVTGETTNEKPPDFRFKQFSALETAIRQLRSAYINAKKVYRIHPRRLERVRSTLSRFVGTQNFHNYTIEKDFRDASAKRVIKSFVVASDPILIGNTEWLSLKVHGQSFMMHQIRKMVTMAALLVRCGCHEGRIQDSYLAYKLSIPKAPGLGLLLERPVFDTYNERLVGEYERQPIDFKKHEKEMEEFKQREIYERIFREEEKANTFHSFFAAIDNLKSARLLYLSSVGLAAGNYGISSGKLKSGDADDATLLDSDSDGEGMVIDDDVDNLK